MEYRIEKDTMGEMKVPADRYWGAQTQRSFQNFKVGGKMPVEIIHAFAYLKNAAACANMDWKVLPPAMKFSGASWTIIFRWWSIRPEAVPRPI